MMEEPEAKTTIAGTSNVSCNLETNWAISVGSLENCVTFESPLSFVGDGDDEVDAIAVDSTYKGPLILHPPAEGSCPCEIKINFAQKHEIRQVYIRSTARVYEIYSAPNLQSSSEYVCTVRCGFASRDGEVLHTPDFEEVVTVEQQVSDKKLEERIRSEEDWVEVKVPDSPVMDGKYTCSTSTTGVDSTKQSQDFFEATAEISDASLCMSVTLRLLSLQSKSCIFVDEIYIFADPIASADPESQESHKENLSSSSSLMAMFLPTLMQLSRTTSLSHINDKCPSVRKEKQEFSAVDLEEGYATDSAIETHPKGKACLNPQEVEFQETNEGCMDLHQSVPSQVAPMKSNLSDNLSPIVQLESNHGDVPTQVATLETTYGNCLGVNVERMLQQLISRMDRLEEICLGFQDKMLIPMSSMETRLQQVEQQLATLTMKLEDSGLPSCSRISATDVSSYESDANSCDNIHGCTVAAGIKSDKKDCQTEILPVSPNEMSDLENTTQPCPGLVVTAPEFPDGEVEEENNASGPEMNSSSGKPKKALSINYALASALAGFISSSASVQSPKYTRSLTVKAPELLNEEADHENDNGSPRIVCEKETTDLFHLENGESINCIPESTSSNCSLESGEGVNRDPNDDQSEQTVRIAEDNGKLCSGKVEQVKIEIKDSNMAEQDLRPGANLVLEKDEGAEIIAETGEDLSSDSSDIPAKLPQNQTNSDSSITPRATSASPDVAVASEVQRKGWHVDIIENVLGFSPAPSVVDFEISLLDVKFTSQKNLDSKPFLEALLVDAPQTDTDNPSIKESRDDLSVNGLKRGDDLSTRKQYDLVSLDDGELVNSANIGRLSVDKDYCTLINAPGNIEGDVLPEKHKLKDDEIFTPTLI